MATLKSLLWLHCCILVVVLSGVIFAEVVEPNDIPVGVCTWTSYVVQSVPASCWSEEPFKRNSTDDIKSAILTVELDECRISSYEVVSVPQGTTVPITIDMEPDDILVEWDENPGDGSSYSFEYSVQDGIIEIEDPNDYDYIRVSANHTSLNWSVHRATQSGTLTITGTGCNEHDVFLLEDGVVTLRNFTKTDDVADGSCISPNDEILYQICWVNDTSSIYSNSYIIDFLPSGVSYPAGFERVDPNTMQIIPRDTNYDPNTHTYVWPLDDIGLNDSGCVELEVVVNEKAEPGAILYNLAELWSDNSETLLARAKEYTNVCCWDEDPDTIYVDLTATGNNNGTCWDDAYIDLADALERAGTYACSDAYLIYMAEGVYNPSNTADETFVVQDNVSIYGGFKSGGCAFKDRKPKKYKTILTGLIDEDEFPDATTIVKMGNDCLLDGCIVEYAGFGGYCIYGSGVDFTVNNCVVQDSYYYGIYADNGDVTVTWCTIRNNNRDGIRHEGEGYELNVSNSWVMRNGRNGVHSRKSKPILKNSIVSESNMSLAEEPFAGIRMYNPSDTPILRNCTFANNTAEGVYFEFDREDTNDPNNPKYPQVRSCIVYYNNSNGQQIKGLNPDAVASYCCIQDCNTLSTSNYNDIPGFAYTVDPNDTIPDPNNYHLAADAFCINMGDPAFSDTAESDYDGEIRVMGSYVDIGADEVNPECSEVENDLDWNVDGILNLHEFNEFSQAWLSHDPADPAIADPNNPLYDDFNDPNSINYIDPNNLANWNEECNIETFYSPYTIGMYDLMEFIDNGYWLWIACWKYEQLEAMSESSTSTAGTMSLMSMPAFSMSSAQAEAIEEETAEEKADSIQASLDLLNSIWETDEDVRQNIYQQQWDDFIDSIETSLYEIQSGL